MEDKTVEPGEGELELGGHCPKREDQNWSVVEESFQPNLVKTAPIILVGSWGLLTLQQDVLYSNLLFNLESFEDEALYVPESVEIDGLKFILEDLNNLLLGKPNKLRGNVENLKRDLTLYILLLFSIGLGPEPQGMTLRRHDGSYNNLGLRFLPKAF